MEKQAFFLGSRGWIAVDTTDPEEAASSIAGTWKGPLGEAANALLSGGGPVTLYEGFTVHMPAEEFPRLETISRPNGDEVLGLQLSPVQSCIIAAADWMRKNNTGRTDVYKWNVFRDKLWEHATQHLGDLWKRKFRRFEVIGMYSHLAVHPSVKRTQIGLTPMDLDCVLPGWRKHLKWVDGEALVPGTAFRMRYPVGSPTGIGSKDVVVLYDVLPGKLYMHVLDLNTDVDGDDDGDGGASWSEKQGVTRVTLAGEFPEPTLVGIDPHYLSLAHQAWLKKRGSGDFVTEIRNKVLGMLAKSIVGPTTHVLNYCATRALAQRWCATGVTAEFEGSKYVQMTLEKYGLRFEDVQCPPQSRRMKKIVTRCAYAAVAQFFNPVLEAEMDQGKKSEGIMTLSAIADSLMDGLQARVSISTFTKAVSPILPPAARGFFEAFLNEVSEEPTEAEIWDGDEGRYWSIASVSQTVAGAWIAAGNGIKKQRQAMQSTNLPEAESLLEALYEEDQPAPRWQTPEREERGRRAHPPITYSPFHKKVRNGKTVVGEPAIELAEILDGVQHVRIDEKNKRHYRDLLEDRGVSEGEYPTITGMIITFWDEKNPEGRMPIRIDLPTCEISGKGRIIRVGTAEHFRPITFRWRVDWWANGTRVHKAGLHQVSYAEFLEMCLMKALRIVCRKGADTKTVQARIQDEFNEQLTKLPRATPGRVTVYRECVEILDPKDWDERVSISESWSEFSLALEALGAYKQIAHGIGFTNKSHPGTVAAFINPEWGTPDFLLGFHPLQKYDDPNPKRWAEYLGIDSAIELANIEDITRAFEELLDLPTAERVSKSYLQLLHQMLPEQYRQQTDWVMHLEDPKPYPLVAEGRTRLPYLLGKEVSLECALAAVENINCFEGTFIGTIGACPSALMKLALCRTKEIFSSAGKKDQYIENLLRAGVPLQAIKVELVQQQRALDVAKETWEVICNWPRLDAGKIKGLAPYKGVITPTPYQLWTKRDGEWVPVDLVLHPQMVHEDKIGLGAVVTGGLVKNGIREVRSDQTIEGLLPLAQVAEETVYLQNVLEANGMDASNWVKSPHLLLQPAGEPEVMGSTVVLPLPFYRPPQTVESTHNRNHPVQVELHAAIHAGTQPSDESRSQREASYLWNQLRETLGSLN